MNGGLYQIIAPRAAGRRASKGKGGRPVSEIERSGPAGARYSETVTAKLALPGTGRNQGSEGDRGVLATECCGFGLHGLGEGVRGRGSLVPLFSAFVLSISRSWPCRYCPQGAPHNLGISLCGARHRDGWRVASIGRYVKFSGAGLAGVGECKEVLGLHFSLFVDTKIHFPM